MMLPMEYSGLVAQLRQEIHAARLHVSLTANRQLLILYWKIGKAILSRQETAGWGTKVIDQFSADLRKEFPDMKGLSVRNLKYMRAFADAYPQFVQGPLAQNDDHLFPEQMDTTIVQASLAQLP
jgi:predicted nuclease of restriction endonuclease-like (RecB) superfamily